MDHIQLVEGRIDINLIQTLITDESCGACSFFVGTTRDNFNGKQVVSLEYEAYESMALKEMGKICADLRTRWPSLKHIAIYHRLGNVPVCEESVVIATSSPHRPAALESVSFAVDQLKSRVPIWKKEIYEKEPVGEWKENVECLWPQSSNTPAETFSFTSCKIDQTAENIPNKLVQIKVNDNDLNRRLKCFLKRKRNEINQNNNIDFKQFLPNSECAQSDDKYSCARTQSILVKQQQSSGHLKVRRVNNCSEQQVRPNYSHHLNMLMTTQDNNNDLFQNKLLRNSRLRNIEDYMCITPDHDNILNRIKNIENRILLLESTSPEYKYFVQFGAGLDNTCLKKSKREVYICDTLKDVIMNITSELKQ